MFSSRWMIVLASLLLCVSVGAFAQLDDDATSVPTTAWGHPDLQGVWDFRTSTPLQRPTSQADKEFLTEEEAALLEAQATERRARLLEPTEVRTEPLAAGGGGRAVGAYNDFWLDYGTSVIADRRTSLMVIPQTVDFRASPPMGRRSCSEGLSGRTFRSKGPSVCEVPAPAPIAPKIADSPSAVSWASTAVRP